MGDDLVTRKGLELDDLGVGDIVTASPKTNDRSYQDVLFEVNAMTVAAVVLTIRWSGEYSHKPGKKILLRRREWRFFEASELLDATLAPASRDRDPLP